MGETDTSVVRMGALAPVLTTLPSVSSAREMRPETGATTWV